MNLSTILKCIAREPVKRPSLLGVEESDDLYPSVDPFDLEYAFCPCDLLWVGVYVRAFFFSLSSSTALVICRVANICSIKWKAQQESFKWLSKAQLPLVKCRKLSEAL